MIKIHLLHFEHEDGSRYTMCDANLPEMGTAVDDVELVDCKECLLVIIGYGVLARERLAELRKAGR